MTTTKHSAGWFKNSNNKAGTPHNPIRHYFIEGGKRPLCGRAAREDGAEPVETTDENSNNCARCQVLKARKG